MRITKKLLVLLLVCLFTACFGEGSPFVGQWQGKEVTLTIKKTGDSFELQSSGRPGEKFKATLQKDGALLLKMPIKNIPYEFSATVSADGKTLYFMGQDFNRVGK